MATKTETTTARDAASSERRSTEPGVGEPVNPEGPIKPVKQFDPRRYQAHPLPAGFRKEIIDMELPSMPRERIEETLPPTTVDEAMRDRSSARHMSVAVAPPRSGKTPPPLPSVIIRPVSTKPRPVTEAPPALNPLGDEPEDKAISFRLALPLAVLIFACGIVATLLYVRSVGQRGNAGVRPTREQIHPAQKSAVPVEERAATSAPIAQPPATATGSGQATLVEAPSTSPASESVPVPLKVQSGKAKTELDGPELESARRAPVTRATRPSGKSSTPNAMSKTNHANFDDPE